MIGRQVMSQHGGSKGRRATEMKASYSFSRVVLAAMVVSMMIPAVLTLQLVPAASTQQNVSQSELLEANKVLVRSAIKEIFNDHNATAVDKYIKEDLIQNDTGFPEGREARKHYFSMLFNAFPDLHASINKMVAEDDLVVVFLSWNGTHKGDFQGMAATNNPITMETSHIFRIEDGMIAEQWETSDTLDLLAKTGVVDLEWEDLN